MLRTPPPPSHRSESFRHWESLRRPTRSVRPSSAKPFPRVPRGALAALGALTGFLILWQLAFISPTPSGSQRPHIGRRAQYSRRSLNRNAFPAPQLRDLVLVACHSVYTGLDFAHVEDHSSWYLLDYQQVDGIEHLFIEHIKLGVQHAAANPNAMLLFSGGKTRRDAGPRAEALGYWLVGEANSWYGFATVRQRAFTEEHARDSFENLLFGLCRFYELTGHYPETVLVVGYEFKRERFADIHRAALRWPMRRFEYVGTPAVNAGAALGEESTTKLFENDPYGCGPELAAKRESRDPFASGGYSDERCPGMAALLQYCGPTWYPGPLPWDENNGDDDNDAAKIDTR